MNENEKLKWKRYLIKKGKDVGIVENDPSQTMIDVASNVQLIVDGYKVLQEELISLWENW